jgi:hypothetical protein
MSISHPDDLTVGRHGNLYEADYGNHRIQMFTIGKSSCIKGTCQKVILIEQSILVPIFFI